MPAGALLNALQQQTAQQLKAPIDSLRLITAWEAGALQVGRMVGVVAARDAGLELPCNVNWKSRKPKLPMAIYCISRSAGMQRLCVLRTAAGPPAARDGWAAGPGSAI